MDNDKLILTAIGSLLAEAYEYKPNQIITMIGDKHKILISSFDDVTEQEVEAELIKLFNEYLAII